MIMYQYIQIYFFMIFQVIFIFNKKNFPLNFKRLFNKMVFILNLAFCSLLRFFEIQFKNFHFHIEINLTIQIGSTQILKNQQIIQQIGLYIRLNNFLNINKQKIKQQMIQNHNISSSSFSDASQIRYQKAVKQISKLIGMNNTMKKDADNFRIMCQSLKNQNHQLFQKYQMISKQNRQFQAKIKNYQLRIRELQSLNQNLRKEQQKQLNSVQLEEQRHKHHQQITMLNEKLNEQGNTIMHLQQNAAQLQKVNRQLKSNNDKLTQDLNHKKQNKSRRASISECFKCQELKKKLKQAIEFGITLQNQILQLNKKHIQFTPEYKLLTYNNKGSKDYMIKSLQQRIRITQQRQKRKNIEVYKLKQKMQMLQQQLKRYKDKQKLFETTAINKQI